MAELLSTVRCTAELLEVQQSLDTCQLFPTYICVDVAQEVVSNNTHQEMLYYVMPVKRLMPAQKLHEIFYHVVTEPLRA